MAKDESRQEDSRMMNEDEYDRDTRENMADDTTNTDDPVL